MMMLVLVAAASAPLGLLAGEWKGTGPFERITVSYSSISNDLATVERWRTISGRETMTVYVDDPAGMRATHYCGQGNVATLQASEASPARTVFDLIEARGVDPGEGVLVKLVLERDDGRLRRIETYRREGRDSTEVIDFLRLP